MLDKIGFREIILYPDSNYFEFKVLDWFNGDVFSKGYYTVTDDSIYLESTASDSISSKIDEMRSEIKNDNIKVIVYGDRTFDKVSINEIRMNFLTYDSTQTVFLLPREELPLAKDYTLTLIKFSCPKLSYIIREERYKIRNIVNDLYEVQNEVVLKCNSLLIKQRYPYSKDSIIFKMPYRDSTMVTLRRHKAKKITLDRILQ